MDIIGLGRIQKGNHRSEFRDRTEFSDIQSLFQKESGDLGNELLAEKYLEDIEKLRLLNERDHSLAVR